MPSNDRYASLLESGDVSIVEGRKIKNRQLFGALGLVAVIALLIFIVFITRDEEDDMHDRTDRILDLEREFEIQFGMKKHLAKYVTPIISQEQRGTCWDFSTMSIAEANYMKQGYENGWLKENEFVRFSTQAYGVNMIDLALKKPEFFPDTQTSSYHATDGYAYWLYLFQDYLKNAIVPWDVPGCEYAPTDPADDPNDDTSGTAASSDYKCDYLHKNKSQNIDRNPIRIEEVKMKTLIDFDDVKEFMKRTDLPAAFSVMLTSGEHYLPCTSDFFSTTTDCKTKAIKCPKNLGYDSEFCAKLDAPAVEDAVFVQSGHEIPRGGHAMNVVGFSDNYMVDSSDDSKTSYGGFVIKNSWGADTGHSMYHYTDDWSSRPERDICPTRSDPIRWVPCDNSLDMYKNQKTTILSCRTTDHHYPKYLKNLGSELDSMHCGVDTRFCYVGSTPLGNGLSSHTFRKWTVDAQKPDFVPANGEDVVVDYLPITALDHVFEISAETKKTTPQNDPSNCGFYFYPYETVRSSNSRYGEFWGLGMTVTFDKCAFAANKHLKECKKYDYTWVEKSTHIIDKKSPDMWVSPMPSVEDIVAEAKK